MFLGLWETTHHVGGVELHVLLMVVGKRCSRLSLVFCRRLFRLDETKAKAMETEKRKEQPGTIDVGFSPYHLMQASVSRMIVATMEGLYDADDLS